MPASKKVNAADSRQKGQKACRTNACKYSSHNVAAGHLHDNERVDSFARVGN